MKKLLEILAGELSSITGMKKIISGFTIMAVLLIGGVSSGGDLSPEATVHKYFNALKNKQFEEAYNYVSQGMKGDRTREKWAEDWKKILEMGEVIILGFSVSAANIEGDTATVRVSNRTTCLLDRKTNPNGVVEHEIDYLVKEKGAWKIDRTDVLIEE